MGRDLLKARKREYPISIGKSLLMLASLSFRLLFTMDCLNIYMELFLGPVLM